MNSAFILAAGYCKGLGGLVEFVNKYLNTPLKIVAVVLFFIFTTLEYARVVFNSDASSKEANAKTLKRFVALLFLFLAPNIINLILKLVEITTCEV